MKQRKSTFGKKETRSEERKGRSGREAEGKVQAVTENREIFYIFLFNCCLRVFVVEINIYRISLQSLSKRLYSVSVIRLVSLRKSSQYSVSAHSFREIVVFIKNSFLLIAYWASVRLAPIDVPERRSCLARTNSCFLSHRDLYRLYICIANFLLFSSETLILITNIRKYIKKNHKKGFKRRVNF